MSQIRKQIEGKTDCDPSNSLIEYLTITHTVFIRIVVGAIIYFEANFPQKYFVNF